VSNGHAGPGLDLHPGIERRRAGFDLDRVTAARLITRLNVRESLVAHTRTVLHRKQWRAVEVRPELADARHVVVMVLKDELPRLDHVLAYYRRLGTEHFVVIDNESADGGREHLATQPDVSLFSATGSFGGARHGTDWVNAVLRRYCVGKWVLWIDVDELLVFSDRSEATLEDLTSALEQAGRRSLQTILLDMYSRRRPSDNVVRAGVDPLTVCTLFDRGGYRQTFGRVSHAGWIKGGLRGRLFFADDIDASPALNKTPLVRWRRHYVFLKVAHQLWPRELNGSARIGGALLHFKFTDATAQKMVDPANRSQHTEEYDRYDSVDDVSYVGPLTTAYTGVGQLTALGLVEPWT